ncbi:MAG: sugar phosphate isomerase/epimerase [Clostridia bacterium]|nr:sugar phosphate isomerase/epimerase [Clostridia bacterium]
MQIGVCCGEKDLSTAARSGFSYLEIPAPGVRDLDGNALALIRERAAGEGIRIGGLNCFFVGNISIYGDTIENLVAFSEKSFRAGEKLGASFCVIGSGRNRSIPEGMDPAAAKDRFMRLIDAIGTRASEYGITVIIEPLRYAETNYINTLAEGIEFSRAVGNPNVGCLVDFYHFYMNKEDLSTIDIIRPGELKHVHIARPDEGRGYPLAEDEPVLRKWAAALRSIGYDGRMTIECSWHDGFENGAARAFSGMAPFLKN